MVLVVKNPPANAGDRKVACLIPGLEKSPGGGPANPLQYSYLENPMDRGAWWAIVHGVAKSPMWLSCFSRVRVGPLRKLRVEELMLLKCGVEENS